MRDDRERLLDITEAIGRYASKGREAFEEYKDLLGRLTT